MTDKELFGNSEQLDVPDTNVGDMISRQAAIDALAEWHDEAITNRLNNLPSAQPSATDTNVATTDSISRADVVDAIEDVDWYHININGEMVHGANDAEHQAWYKSDDIYAAIERVPSTQPVAKDTSVPVNDCISRQAALEALGKRPMPWTDDDDYVIGGRNQYDSDRLALETVPSAQQWIPYDYENIPSPGENVLVTYKCDDGTSEVAEGVWIQPFIVDNCFMDREVTAWMPLPEPYQEKE